MHLVHCFSGLFGHSARRAAGAPLSFWNEDAAPRRLPQHLPEAQAATVEQTAAATQPARLFQRATVPADRLAPLRDSQGFLLFVRSLSVSNEGPVQTQSKEHRGQMVEEPGRWRVWCRAPRRCYRCAGCRRCAAGHLRRACRLCGCPACPPATARKSRGRHRGETLSPRTAGVASAQTSTSAVGPRRLACSRAQDLCGSWMVSSSARMFGVITSHRPIVLGSFFVSLWASREPSQYIPGGSRMRPESHPSSDPPCGVLPGGSDISGLRPRPAF